MPEQLFFTRFLNHLFAGAANALLNAVHMPARHPQAPIDNAFTMEVLVVLVLIAFFVLVRISLSVEKPGPVQHLAELLHGFVSHQSQEIIGHGYERFVPFLTVVGLFIVVCNLIGLIPGFESPTASVVVPCGMAILVFCYSELHGFRANGFAYIKQFLGPVWWLAPLLLPIEIVSHLTRMLSLTVRLYANMLAGDLLTMVFFSLVPLGLPVVFLGLHLGVALIQAYLFMLLGAIYLSQAIAHEH